MCARTVIARVTGSTREPTVRTVPSNSRSGKLTLFATILAPGAIAPTNVSGTVKSSLMTEMSSIDVIVVFGLSNVPGLTCRKPSRPLNGARMSRSRSRATMLLRRAWLAPARERATSSSEAEVKPRPLKSCNLRS